MDGEGGLHQPERVLFLFCKGLSFAGMYAFCNIYHTMYTIYLVYLYVYCILFTSMYIYINVTSLSPRESCTQDSFC